MAGSHCTIAISSHLTGRESPLNQVFWWYFLVGMAEYSSLSTITCLQKLLASCICIKKGFAALEEQYMAPIVTYHSSFETESGPQIRHFSIFWQESPLVLLRYQWLVLRLPYHPIWQAESPP